MRLGRWVWPHLYFLFDPCLNLDMAGDISARVMIKVLTALDVRIKISN